MSEKIRLDLLVAQKYLNFSRNKIQNMIVQGQVFCNGKVLDKPGCKVDVESQIDLDLSAQKYVSRAGFKLEKALIEFQIKPQGLVCLDCGISTGGFTDCLLQQGAFRVYGVDVGHGQTSFKLLDDSRLILIEKTNLKDLESLPEKVDLITLDLSFISLLKVFPSLFKFLKTGGKIIALIKPQFEVGKDKIGKSGIVTDSKLHQKVLKDIELGLKEIGFDVLKVIESPILGSDGNKEFLALIVCTLSSLRMCGSRPKI